MEVVVVVYTKLDAECQLLLPVALALCFGVG